MKAVNVLSRSHQGVYLFRFTSSQRSTLEISLELFRLSHTCTSTNKWQRNLHSFAPLISRIISFAFALNNIDISNCVYISAPSDPCQRQPCRNGGSCLVDSRSPRRYRCRCRPNYSGTNCESKLRFSWQISRMILKHNLWWWQLIQFTFIIYTMYETINSFDISNTKTHNKWLYLY